MRLGTLARNLSASSIGHLSGERFETLDALDADALWDELIQFIDEGLVVPVLGQDLLKVRVRGRELPLYAYLAERLAERLGIQPDPGVAPTLNSVVCRYVEQGKPVQTVYSALKMVMPPPAQIAPPEALLKLAEIRKFRLFVTTTFDSLLTTALNQCRFGGAEQTMVRVYSLTKVEDLPPEEERASRSVVYHLLGRLTVAPEYAVTDEDMLEFIHRLQSEDHQPKLLFDELRDKSLLVIGCAFSDWLARFFIRLAQQRRLIGADKRAWVADEGVHRDESLVFFLKHFSQMTQVFPGSALAFVDELHRRWTAAHPAAGAAAPPGSSLAPSDEAPEESVFLSYASEDRPSADAIKQALQVAEIDVWFDKEQLGSGDQWSDKIKKNIRRCALFVPIISRHALTVVGRQFRMEWDVAAKQRVLRRRDLEFIVPVAIDDTSEQLEAWPDEFRECQWARLPGGQVTDAFVDRLKQLVRKVRSANQAVV